MTTRRFDYDPANVDTDGIADGLATGSAWSYADTALWLLDRAPDGLAHRLGVTTNGDEPGGNAPVMTITGTDADGNVITDDVTLPSSNVVTTSEYFLTVISAVTQTDTIAACDIGWVDEFVSETIYLDEEYASNWQIVVTGTLSIDTDWCLKDFRVPTLLGDQNSEPWVDGSGPAGGLDAETTSSTAVVVVVAGYVAMRFRMNSYSSGAEFQAYLTQASRRYNESGLPG